MDLDSLMELFETGRRVLAIVGGFLGAAVIVVTTAVVLCRNAREAWRLIVKPLWRKVLKPLLRFVLLAATMATPVAIVVWYVVYQVVVYWTPIMTRPDVFLFVVLTSTAIISAYALLWGLWIYPAVIRPRCAEKEEGAQQPADTEQEQLATLSEGKEGGECDDQDQRGQHPTNGDQSTQLPDEGGRDDSSNQDQETQQVMDDSQGTQLIDDKEGGTS